MVETVQLCVFLRSKTSSARLKLNFSANRNRSLAALSSEYFVEVLSPRKLLLSWVANRKKSAHGRKSGTIRSTFPSLSRLHSFELVGRPNAA